MYKDYNLATRTIYTSKDVLFYKHVFPFRDSCIQPSTHPVMQLSISEFPNAEDTLPHVGYSSSSSPIDNDNDVQPLLETFSSLLHGRPTRN